MKIFKESFLVLPTVPFTIHLQQWNQMHLQPNFQSNIHKLQGKFFITSMNEIPRYRN